MRRPRWSPANSCRPVHRFVVIEGDETAAGLQYRATLELAVEEGAVVVSGWSPPPGGGVVCAGPIRDVVGARAALLAAMSGAGLVATISADRDTIDQFLDDLRRLGPVDHVTSGRAPSVRLDREQRALLGLLAEGLSLGEAARELGLSRRTADRRLAAARRILGVQTTAEAIVASRRGAR